MVNVLYCCYWKGDDFSKNYSNLYVYEVVVLYARKREQTMALLCDCMLECDRALSLHHAHVA